MALASIHNRRGFFSDYWLGTLAAARSRDGARLTAAQARKLLDRLRRLTEGINGADPPDLTRFRERFARPLLEDLLGFALRENAEEPRLRPLATTHEPDAEPVAAIHLLPEADALDTPAVRRHLESALDHWKLDYGFLLTPEVLRLIRRPGAGARGAALDVHLSTLVEQDDLDSLQVLYRLLSAQNFVRGDDGTRPIDRLEAESRRHSAKVSGDLKQAVFDAAERIVGGLLADVRSRPEVFASQPSLQALRDAGFLALYRLLFILYAEARDERLIRHAFYQQHYSLDSLVTKLLRAPVDTLPANRFSLWAHLLALFRIFNEGIAPHLPELENIPPRGGYLFSDETPEGCLVRRLRLDDRSTAHVLLALATTKPRRGVGRERVSFRELDIEQLGNVYQGLLEYEPAEAGGTMIECRAQGREFVLTPDELVRLAETKSLIVRGDVAIVEGTEAARLHPETPDTAAADDEDETDDEADVEEETGEEETEDAEEEADKGIKSGETLRLLRRLEAGDFFFKPGTARKASGSYYTPTPIVDYLVREALAPLVADKSAADIERLRVIDLACGSAHFLVGAARFLGARLFEAYWQEGQGDPPPAFYPDRKLSTEVHARWDDEGPAWCKRRIVEHCLYGVDLNPAAVQLAQVALWIESLAGDRPLSFFAHHIRCGNSLLGSSLATFDQPPHPRLGKASDRRTLGLFEAELKRRLADALEERKLIDAPLPPEVRADTPEEFIYKADRLRRAEEATKTARLLLDLRSAAAFVPEIWASFPTLMSSAHLEADARACNWWDDFQHVRERERFFHWELEFPEVFAAGEGTGGGFDCVLGNPPWEKIKPDRKEFYGRADVLIRAYTGGELDARIRELEQAHPELSDAFDRYADRLKTLATCLKSGGDYRYVDWAINGRSTGGDPDLFKFFLERAHQVLKPGGRLGYLVPSALYNNEGCTGLRHLLLDEMQIERFYGFENRKKIFNIHSSYKFVCLVAKKQTANADAEFHAAFMRHDLDELASGPPSGVEVLIRRSEIERLSPGTLAFLEYRSERDRELVLAMYGLLPGQTPRPLLGDKGPGAWNVRFYREFDMTNDRDLWTDPVTSKLYNPRQILGPVLGTKSESPYYDPAAWPDIRARMAEKGFWPLYQEAHIHQYVCEFKPIMRWVKLEAAQRKYGRIPPSKPRLVIRRPTRNTDERTCIAALLPDRSCFGDTLTAVDIDEHKQDHLLAVLNSFVFDYEVRQRVGGRDLRPYQLSVLAVPLPDNLRNLRTITSFSQGGATQWVYEIKSQWEFLFQIELAVAQAYGLTADDLAHILSTFPVFARKRPAFYAYLLARVKEWKEETGASSRRRYARRDSESALPQAAEDMPPYGKGPETARDS